MFAKLMEVSNFEVDGASTREIMEETKVLYHVNDEDTPYLVKLPISSESVLFGDLKNALGRPNYKYFFKSLDDDFGMVKEEIIDDTAHLPCVNGRVICWLVATDGSTSDASSQCEEPQDPATVTTTVTEEEFLHQTNTDYCQNSVNGAVVDRRNSGTLDTVVKRSTAGTSFGEQQRIVGRSTGNLQPSGPSATAKVRLPKLQLKSFSGDVLLWPEFWDLYEVSVHNNDDIPVVQKFVHLKSLLTGEAAKCIESIKTTEANYSVALERLQNRYAKKEAQRHKLMVKLSEMKNMENYKCMRDAVDELTATIRALQIQGVTMQEYGALLMPLIEARLPKAWKLEWARKKVEIEEVTFRHLIDFLELEVEVREMADRDLSERQLYSARVGNDEDIRDELGIGTATALEIKSGNVKICTFCGDPHKPADCNVSMSVDDRFHKVREAKACFRCAMPRHYVSSCRWKKLCSCGRLHIPQLCTGPRSSATLSASATPFQPQQDTPPTLSVNQADAQGYGHGLRMRTVSVRLGQHTARALCDTGSTYTLMSSRLASRIPHRVLGKRKLKVQTFGRRIEEQFPVIRITAQGIIRPEAKVTMDVLVSDAVAGNFEQLDADSVQMFRSHFGEQAVLADISGGNADPLDIIIGEDYYDTVVIGHPVALSGGLKATLTIFGWMLHGSGSQSSVHTNTACVLKATVQEQLAEFWNLEHLGVSTVDLNERDIECDIRDSLCRNECGQYTVEWPWKPQGREHLALNKTLSERRLQKLITRMSDEEYNAYDSHIRQLENDGHIEVVPQDDAPESYLPHRGVVKSSSTTTKLRIVYDASAKSAGLLSLNEALEKGPNLLPLLWGILLRFRLGRIAVVGDLEKAFLQILLQEKDRRVCCFLWKPPDGHIVTYRLTRVFFGAISSPFLLQVVLKHHLENETVEEDVAHTLLRNLYVDDTVNSVNSESEAEEFWYKSVQIFMRGGFNLRKLQTNAKSLWSSREDESVHKVLGVSWHIENDELMPLAEFQPSLGCASKREVASLVASIYDPLGLIVPVVTPLKCLLQDLWKQKTAWDAPINEAHQQRLDKILSDMMNCGSVTVPRWLNTSVRDCSQDVSIHVFVDASSRAYAAVDYLCVRSDTETITTFVTAKSRLAPPSGETIPRLELMAIVMGGRLLKSLRTEFADVLSVNRWILWSDSTIALSWVEKGPSVGGVFVANRVKEIHTLDAEKRWVPGDCNPADLPTRGTSIHELQGSSLWWKGPSWLELEETCWPQSPAASATDVGDETHTSASYIVVDHNTVLEWLTDLVDPTRTSKWRRTVRSLCWMLRWKYPDFTGCIQPLELERATRLIYRQVQKKFFTKELFAIESGEAIPRQSVIASLHPFLHEGLLRMGGRLQQCVGTYSEKHPVLVKRCGVIDQLIQDVHEQMQHAGVSFVISELRRQGVWILRPKKSVSSVVRCCRRCRRFIAAPAAEVTAPFPHCRVSLTRAFSTTGMDLGGPLHLKDESKAWFVVFTCMSVRAIHLELVTALSEEALVFAVQRFIARRGTPKKFVSDHGSNFVALSSWLKRHCVDIQYEFIVERGPWWGGVWERLVQTVKGLLRRSIGKALLTWEQLETVMTEIEKVINRRPISFQWEGPQPCGGVPVPVYPELFLLPPQDSTESQRDQDITAELQLRKSYFEEINNIWHREYLHQVLGAKGEVWRSSPNPVQLGEVVLVGDGDKRLCWKLGVIQELHRGRDGRCRAAAVRVQGGLLRRPIQNLYKLELCASDVDDLLAVDNSNSSDSVEIDSSNTDVCSDDADTCNAETEIRTRAGRLVRKPNLDFPHN